jgi:hypothetical protein
MNDLERRSPDKRNKRDRGLEWSEEGGPDAGEEGREGRDWEREERKRRNPEDFQQGSRNKGARRRNLGRSRRGDFEEDRPAKRNPRRRLRDKYPITGDEAEDDWGLDELEDGDSDPNEPAYDQEG